MNTTNIEFTKEKIWLTCEGKTSSYNTKSKNPQKAMIARIMKLTNQPRSKVGKFVKKAFSSNEPSDIDKKLDDHYKRVEERLEEHFSKIEAMMLRFMPNVAQSPESVTSSEASLKDEVETINDGILDDVNQVKTEDNEVIEFPQVELGTTKVLCEYDIESKKLYKVSSGQEVGSVDYFSLDDSDCTNEEHCDSEGYYDIYEECCRDLNDERILIFKMNLDKISMKELGEFHVNFKNNPYYCTHNVEQDNRYIDFVELGCNWEGRLFKCGMRDDLINFL